MLQNLKSNTYNILFKINLQVFPDFCSYKGFDELFELVLPFMPPLSGDWGIKFNPSLYLGPSVCLSICMSINFSMKISKLVCVQLMLYLVCSL